MYSDDYSYSDRLERCDGCGKYFPKSDLKKCRNCGAVLCPECQKRHVCFTNPLTHTTRSYTISKKERETIYHEPKQKIKSSSIGKYLFIGFIVLVILTVGVILALNAGDIADSFKPDPHIVLDTSVSGEQRTIISFDVGSGITESVTVKADAQVYSGAKLPQSREISTENYWVMMTKDEAQEEFYDTLVSQFNTIMQRHGFTSDQFVEMVTSFVQTIPYDATANVIPQYPVVTALDNMGDCDEKSMLLVGILSHAGYDVALLDFEADEHMAAGIKLTNDYGYIDGYGVIETTNEGFYVTETDLKSHALVYPVGTGTKTYDVSYQVKSILLYFELLDEKWDSIESGVTVSEKKANDIFAQYEQTANERELVNSRMADLNHQYSAGSMSYEDYLSQWNQLESKYYSLTQEMTSLENQYLTQFNTYSDTLDSRNDWAEIYNILSLAKVCDRAEIYRYITLHPLK